MKRLTLDKSNFLRRLMCKVLSNVKKFRLISNCYLKKLRVHTNETAIDKFLPKEYKRYIRTWRKTHPFSVFFDSMITRDI